MNKIHNILLTLSIFFLLIAGFLHPITALTQDLGRHLLMGEIILKNFTVPNTNLFSYTYPDFPFINTHWLSEVMFYAIHQFVGFNGLLIISTAIVVFSFGLVFFSATSSPRYSGERNDSRIRFWTSQNDKVLAATIASIIYLRVLFERTDIRPEIFSFFFLSIFIVILYKYREQYTRWIFLLPFLELLWVNTHIYFPIGIAILGLFFIDLIIKYRKNIYSKYIGIFIVILCLSTLVIQLNPNGISGALYPFHVFQNYGYQIEENQTVFFLWNYFGGKTTILYFFISTTLLFLTLSLTIKKSRLIDWLLAIFFTYLAANAERNLPLFVFGTFIPFTRSLSIIFQKLATMKQFSNVTMIRYATTTLLIIIMMLQIKQIFELKSFGIGVAKGAERGADFFLENNLKGPIFNNFDIGSYLDYRLYPKERVFIDGRPEAYPAAFIQNAYIPMQDDQKIFEQEDKKYRFNTVFFSHTDMTPWAQTFLKRITQDAQWKIVYLDDYVIILLKNTPENTALIKKYGLDQTPHVDNLKQADKMSLLRLANFFRVVGWQNQEENTYQQLVLVDPTNCAALYNLATILSQHNDATTTIYVQRFQESCR